MAMVLLLSQPLTALACGPFFEQAVLVHTAHPDFPLSEYARGNIGIIRPNFARSYLAVAYRYLVNKPLSPAEQKAALSLWNFRLLSTWDDQSKSLDSWRAARKAFTTAAGCDIDQYRALDAPDGSSWQTYLNCPNDAFTTAVATLNQRVAKYGQNSPVVKDWLKAQDQVFCHCDSPRFDFEKNKRDPEPAFPAALPATADPLAKADRAYQIAAANFYGQKYDDALNQFQAIAKDASSPWSVWAPYLVARTIVRKATTAPEMDTAMLARADEQIGSVLSNASLSATHSAAQQLRNFVRIRLFPEQTLHELAAKITSSNAGDTLDQDLTDYTVLFDNILGLTSDDIGGLTYSKLPLAVKQDDLSDWIATFQSTDDAAREHAIERYRATHSTAWLVAALTKADPKQPITDSLIDSAMTVPTTSLAFLTAFYRAAQLLHSRSPAVAKSALDKALARTNIPPSSKNLLLDERTKYATNLKEFITLSIRTPAVLSSDYEGNELPDDTRTLAKMTTFYSGQQVLSPIGADFFNLTATTAQLAEAVQIKLLPAPTQKNFVQAAWARAFLIDDKAIGDKMSPMLRQSYPSMVSELMNFENTTGPARRFAGTYVLLRNPGMRPFVNWGLQRTTPINKIDNYQDNWWSNKSAEWPSLATAYNLQPTQQISLPGILAKGNANEMAKVKALGPAATFLTREAIVFAKARPTDARIPEALALAVKATRFGPKDAETSKLSKEAFQILHRSYPKTQWAKQTPYFY